LIHSTRQTSSENAIIHHTIAIVVDTVANLGARTDETLARSATRLRPHHALTRSAVRDSPGRAHGNASCRWNSVVNLTIAVVINAVADFRLRIVVACGKTTTHHARARLSHRLRRFTLNRTGTIRRRHLTARNACCLRYAIVGDTIAIVVASIARFGRWNATATDTIIDDAIAIVILTIACFRRRTMRWNATLKNPLVGSILAIVVDVVANLFRIVTKPLRRILLLRIRGARQ
jgi:hypothetical protein